MSNAICSKFSTLNMLQRFFLKKYSYSMCIFTTTTNLCTSTCGKGGFLKLGNTNQKIHIPFNRMRCVFSRGMAGHAHWQNIMRIKAAKDAKKASVITQHCSNLRQAIHEGGSNNPKLNQKLANAIEAAKFANVPGRTIEAVCKRAANVKLKTCIIELQGPGNSLLLIEVEAENPTIADHEIKVLCRRHGNCKFVKDGSILKQFIYKGVVTVADTSVGGSAISIESATDLAIEAGAENVHALQIEEEKTAFEFMSSFQDYHKMKNYLEKNGCQVLSASLHYLPTRAVDLTESELASLTNLQERLATITVFSVLNVYDNVAWPNDKV